MPGTPARYCPGLSCTDRLPGPGECRAPHGVHAFRSSRFFLSFGSSVKAIRGGDVAEPALAEIAAVRRDAPGRQEPYWESSNVRQCGL